MEIALDTIKREFGEPIGEEEEQHTFSVKLVKMRARRDGVPLAEIRVRKLTD